MEYLARARYFMLACIFHGNSSKPLLDLEVHGSKSINVTYTKPVHETLALHSHLHSQLEARVLVPGDRSAPRQPEHLYLLFMADLPSGPNLPSYTLNPGMVFFY